MNAFVQSPLAPSNLKIILPGKDHPRTDGTTIHVFTDGACIGNPGPGGCGFLIQRRAGSRVIKEVDVSGPEPFDTTNNRMEMQAVVEALKVVPRGETAPVIITSDSQLVIKGANEWAPRWIAKGWKLANGKAPANRDLWQQILDLSKGLNITWVWVKGHAGNPLNERVDALAEAAAKVAMAIKWEAE